MKKILTIISFIFFTVILSSVSAKSIGTVEKYNILTGVKTDGGVNATYTLELKVDENHSGEVSSIYFGLPSDNFKVLELGVNVKDIVLDGNKTARIDFYAPYKAGETISLKFRLTHYNMYRLNKSKDLCMYDYTPGKLKEFSENDVIIGWRKDKVQYSGTSVEKNYNYVWEEKISWLKKIVARVHYKMSDLKVSEDGQRKYDFASFVSGGDVLFVIVGLIVILEIVIHLIRKKNSVFYK